MQTPRTSSKNPSSFKRTTISIALAVLAFGLSTCAEPELSPTPAPTEASSGPTPAPTPVLEPTSEMAGSVSIWTTWKPEGIRALNELIEEFSVRHSGFTFALTYVPTDDLRMALDEASTLPSLIFAPSTWARELSEAGLIQDLSGYPTEEFRVLTHPLPWAQSTHDGQVLGVPLRMHGNVLYRNRDVATIPAGSVEGLVQADAALRGTLNQGVAQDYGFGIVAPFAGACGGQLMLDGAAPDLEDPVARCWLELLRDFTPAGPVVFNSDEDRELFEAGQAGWLIESTEIFDELQAALGEANLAIDSWPAYQATGEPLAGYVWTENAYFSPNLSEDDFEAAWEFMAFLLSSDSQLLLSNPNGAANIPVHISAPPLPGYVGQMHSSLLQGTALPTSIIRPEYIEVLERAARAVSALGTPVNIALQRAITELAGVPDV